MLLSQISTVSAADGSPLKSLCRDTFPQIERPIPSRSVMMRTADGEETVRPARTSRRRARYASELSRPSDEAEVEQLTGLTGASGDGRGGHLGKLGR
ncbi:hypothetical protein NHX12_032955 [Muraenolepis orangiensis]|uniref:Uncharacterized protein n=1 Tax=Muraenolepis orangiensis TaxID=630683 RepID=A0A9Q0IFW6_9TELE|nr:hypothetical protein NHX12_032955 [Muraenolepis orangiensis]